MKKISTKIVASALLAIMALSVTASANHRSYNWGNRRQTRSYVVYQQYPSSYNYYRPGYNQTRYYSPGYYQPGYQRVYQPAYQPYYNSGYNQPYYNSGYNQPYYNSRYNDDYYYNDVGRPSKTKNIAVGT